MNVQPARVAVVVPVFNGERHIAATVDSVCAQTFRSWELNVVDDGSTDSSVEIVRRYAATEDRIRLEPGPNEGVAAARNRGLAMSDRRSTYVIFLDHDDVWLPTALEALVDVLDTHDEYVSVHGLARCIDADGRPPPGDDLFEQMQGRRAFDDGGVVPLGLDEPTTFRAVAFHNWIVTPGVHLIRRTVLDDVGGFDPATVPADDWDLALRISRCGDIGFLEKQVLWWRRHDATYSETSARFRRGSYRALDKMFTDRTNTPDQQAAARQSYRRSTNGSWRGARTALAARRAVPALKGFVKAVEGEAHYARANAVKWVTR